MTQEQSKTQWTEVTPRLAGHMALWLGIAACLAMFVPAALCSETPAVALLLALIGIATAVASLIGSRRSGASAGLRVIAILACSAPIGLLILLPLPGPHHLDDARKSMCMNNLKCIGGAIRWHTYKWNSMVARLQDLVDAGYVSQEAFKCPGDKDWQRGQSSYFFHGAGEALSDTNGKEFIACDLRNRHRDGRCFLSRAGNIQFVREEDVDARLAQPENAAFAAALRTFEATGATHFPLDRPISTTRPAP